MRPTQIRSRQVASPWRAPCRIPGLRQSSANYLLQCLDAGDQPAAAAALGLGHVPDLAEGRGACRGVLADHSREFHADRKSTRLNSSHSQISYAVFCLKKKKNKHQCTER